MGKKGSILMITLWTLAILVVFALGLGHRAAINLRLARYQRDRLKAYYLAGAGIQKASVELDKDQNGYDSLNETWSTGLDDPTGKSLFENVEIKPGSGEKFTVRYLYDRDRNIYLCMADEERRININSATQPLLLILVKEAGIEETQAQELVSYIRIWRGDGSSEPGLKADEDLYRDFKKAPFVNPEELIIVLEFFYKDKAQADYRSKAQEIFGSLRDLITVYGNTTVNINTVSEKILMILTTSLAENDEQRNSVAKVVSEIMKLREEKKYFEKIEDIQVNLAPGGPDEALFNNLKVKFVFKSDYFKIESSGNVGNLAKKITAIYDSADKKIVYWHEN